MGMREEVTDKMRAGMSYVEAMSEYQREHPVGEEKVSKTQAGYVEKYTKAPKKEKAPIVSKEEPTEQEIRDYEAQKYKIPFVYSQLTPEEKERIMSEEFLELPEAERTEYMRKLRPHYKELKALEKKVFQQQVLSKTRYPAEIEKLRREAKKKQMYEQYEKAYIEKARREKRARNIDIDRELQRRFVRPLQIQRKVGVQKRPEIRIKPKKELRKIQVPRQVEVQRPKEISYPPRSAPIRPIYTPLNAPGAEELIYGKKVPTKGKKAPEDILGLRGWF
jgi:hypothetical protein